MSHLLEDSSGDPTYVEDFLLTHRIFIDTPLIVCSKLLEWYAPLYPFFFYLPCLGHVPQLSCCKEQNGAAIDFL